MKAQQHDPLRLDVAAFVAAGAGLRGDWPGADLTRLAELQTPPQDMALAQVVWQADGQPVPVTGSETELWLSLKASVRAWLTCQRCLQPFEQTLDVQCRLRFVRGESQAEALDAELEEDVLALARSLNLRDLIEDELLLALPLVPRHETCPQPLPVRTDVLPDPAPDEQPAHPFAALQALKRRSAD